MSDFCPPTSEWRYFANPEPMLAYINFTIGALVGAAVWYFTSMLARGR